MLEQNKKINNETIIKDLSNTDNKNVAKNEVVSSKQGIHKENSNTTKATKPSFIDTFKANIIDLIAIGVVSTIVVFVADAILKLAGYAISQKFQMTFILFMVVMVLYMSIMESGKSSATIGKKVSGLFITKR
ncbi:RDD family protein [Clostridium algoriphilum]|uniref:RDD family protein n=1 Tax=Clostridium algoriphilum TaxID=198347 RepID=UPI001CF1AAB5|nr:RDD family protein [Clostridium algoriphilum]MCB2292590.1 RDD family protein [Clostridium algoriphilum]